MSLWSGRWLSLSGSLLIWIETSVSMNHNNTTLPPAWSHSSVVAQPYSFLCPVRPVQSEIQWKEKLQTNLREVACSIFAQKRAYKLISVSISLIQCLEHFLNFPLCSSPLKNHDFDCILGMEASKKSRWSFWRYYISSERRPRYWWWARMTIRNLNRSFWERSNGGNVHCESWRWSVRPDQSWHN